jgi:hypothetical protein
MSDKFLGSGGSSSTNLTNGTVPFYGASLGAESLSPGLPVKVNSLRQLITSKLNISDISGLQTALSNSGIKNPLTANLNIGVWDIINLPDGKTLRGITDEVGAFDAEIKALDDKTINISSIVGTTTFSGDIKSSSVSTGFLYDESKSVRIEATPTTFDIQAPFLKFNGNDIITSPYPSLLEANGFLKTGGTNIQYLMANGSTLTQSANSGNSNYYLYNNNTSLNPIPPIGAITFDTATQNTATMIYISHRTRDNVDIEVFFKQISTLTDIYIQDQETSLNYIQYNVLSAPVITSEAQVAISVNLSIGAGTGLTNFGNGHNILLSFFTNSLEVDTRLSNVESKTSNILSADGKFGTTFSGIISSNELRTNQIGDVFGDGVYIEFDPLNIKLYSNTLTYNDYNIITSAYLGSVNITGTMTASGFVVPDEPTAFLLSNGTLDLLIIPSLQTKTQNLTAGVNISTFTGSLTVGSLIRNGGTSDEFLKGNGTIDTNNYTNTQFIQTISPATLINSNTEADMTGTGLSSNNMSMTWNDQLYYSRNIRISGLISHNSGAIMTLRFRITSGTIILAFPITLQGSVSASVPFVIEISYIIKAVNFYTISASYNEAGSSINSSHIYTATTSCLMGNYARQITAQFSGAPNAQNSFSPTSMIITNNYIG